MTDDPRDQTDASPWLSAAWMQTYTGVAFRPWSADPDDVRLEDIAHSLSLQCRYNGHTSAFYSVAQHAVLLAHHALSDHRVDDARWALMHDAAEAYIGDMVRPVKVEMPDFRALDDALTATIGLRFDLARNDAGQLAIPDYVKSLDARILLDERDALLSAPPKAWDVDQLTPLGISIVPWTPAESEEAFLSMWAQLERLRELGVDAVENPNAPALGTLARLFYDHDFDRMECSNHDRRCCPAGCHDLTESQHEHYARVVDEAGYDLTDDPA